MTKQTFRGKPWRSHYSYEINIYSRAKFIDFKIKLTPAIHYSSQWRHDSSLAVAAGEWPNGVRQDYK